MDAISAFAFTAQEVLTLCGMARIASALKARYASEEGVGIRRGDEVCSIAERGEPRMRAKDGEEVLRGLATGVVTDNIAIAAVARRLGRMEWSVMDMAF